VAQHGGSLPRVPISQRRVRDGPDDLSLIHPISSISRNDSIELPSNLDSMNTITPWFAIQTEPRSEKNVERSLVQKGYECFLPMYCQKRRWSDRVVTLELPLFPRYIFCRFNSSALGKAVSTPGVSRIVGFGGKPVEVDVGEIEALQLLAQSTFLREPWKYLPDGTVVQIETGPLTGIQGIISQSENKRRLIISVTLLQRSVAIQLDEGTIVTVVADQKGHSAGLSFEADVALRLLNRK
jgi:transcription antitermination factor NusG